MSVQLDAALEMARRGFRVFPLRPYGKRPAIDQFQILATTDVDQINTWWMENPQYNLGVLTTDYVVVDIDVRKGDHAIKNYQAAGGHFDTFVVRTATGGYHAYFEGPDSKLAADLVPGVDVRSHNGYVVGPGSYVDRNLSGEKDIYATGQYNVVTDAELAWVPTDIEALLERPGRKQRNDAHVELDTATAIANAAVWAADTAPAIEGQGGDNLTYQTAVKLVRDFALTEETAFTLLLKHWNPRCQPPWEYAELYKKVQNAAEYGQGNLGTALPEFFFKGVTVVAPPPPETPEARGVSLGNLLDPAAVPPRPWLIQRLALRGEVTMLASPGSGGKSMILLTAACHWAVGKDYGAYKLKENGVPLRTLIYNAEDDLLEQSRRVLAICHNFGLDYDTVRSNLCVLDDSLGEVCFVSSANRAMIVNDQAVNFFIDAAKYVKADVIIAEPLVNLHSCNENDNGEMRFVITTLRRMARETNCAIMVAHHTTKGVARSGDEGGIRGAGAIVNSSRVAVMLSGATEEDIKTYGLRPEERNYYVRMDDAKTNLFLKSHGAIMWMKWNGQRIVSGDIIGVPVPTNIQDREEAQREHIGDILHKHLLMEGAASIIRAEAIRILKANDPLYHVMEDHQLRRLLEDVLKKPINVGADQVVLVREKNDEMRIKLQ